MVGKGADGPHRAAELNLALVEVVHLLQLVKAQHQGDRLQRPHELSEQFDNLERVLLILPRDHAAEHLPDPIRSSRPL